MLDDERLLEDELRLLDDELLRPREPPLAEPDFELERFELDEPDPRPEEDRLFDPEALPRPERLDPPLAREPREPERCEPEP